MRKLIAPVLLLLLVLVIFHSWFASGLLLSFDFPFYSQLMMKGAGLQLYAWDWHLGFDGFAGFFSPYSWVFPLIYMPQVVFGNLLGMDWASIERVVYLYPLLILLIFSPIFFFKTLFPRNKFYLISVLVFSFNTFSLLMAGGEIFIALAYALMPLIFALFLKITDYGLRITDFRERMKHSVILGLVLAAQIMVDPRIAYVTMFAVGLYLLFIIVLRIANYEWRIKSEMRNTQLINYKIIIYLLIPFIITVLLHSFWLIPTVLYGKNPVVALGSSYSTTEAVKYLSFTKLEQTISLLHPNWPENIFGMTYFMRWEFLLLPILAYASLLFIKRKQTADNRKQIFTKSSQLDDLTTLRLDDNKVILFFALLGLIGAFLAKGANDPFGELYLWMFGHIPGFIMFRDPSKWYPLVAISYSILIPFSVLKIYEWLKSRSKFSIFNFQFLIKSKIFNASNLFLLVVVCYLLFLISPALSGQLGGMFKKTTIPQDYVKLEKFLYDQPSFFRTLWFPSKQRFGFYSNTHPEMSARILFNTFDDDELLNRFSDRGVERLLQEASIKYVIVPYDSEKEIFITDRKYDNTRYLRTISWLQEIKWLKEVLGFGKIKVFELSNFKDHFWSPAKNIKITYNYINPTKYLVSIKNANKDDLLVFSEAFDPKWSSDSLSPIPYLLSPNLNLNSFVLPENGDYSLEIYYKPQKWVDLGTKISLITFSLTVFVLVALSLRKL